MNNRRFGRWRIATLSFLLILALAACVRPSPVEESNPTPDPLVEEGEPTLSIPLPTVELTLPEVLTSTVTTDVLTDANEDSFPLDGQDVTPPDSGSESKEVTYVVQSGDTLSGIAQQYNVSVDALASANGLSDVHVLDVDQILIIPVGGDGTAVPIETDEVDEPVDPGAERIHIVQVGENLFRIAYNLGFTAEELAAYNGIADPTQIDVGQEIRIPPGGN